MQVQKQHKKQSEILSEQLLKVAADVTRGDRQAFLKDHSFSKTTLSNYLNGIVHDNDTAVTIINYMKQKIADRYAALK